MEGSTRTRRFVFLAVLSVVSVTTLGSAEELSRNEANSFNALLGTKHLFVKFYAPWCGHCKALAPVWDMLAAVVAPDRADLEVLMVDGTQEPELAEKYNIRGYPTLLYFKKGWVEGENPLSYDAPRDLPSMVAYLNANAGTMRSADGHIDGRLPAVDALLKDVKCMDESLATCGRKMIDKLTKRSEELAESLNATEIKKKFMDYYTTVLKKISEEAKGFDWISKEIERISGIIEKQRSNLNMKSLDSFMGRKSILENLQGIVKAAVKPDAKETEKSTEKGEEL